MSSGDITLVRFPFTSLDQSKKRPALVLTKPESVGKLEILTLAMITSQIEGIRLSGDVLLEDWESAKLLHPSLIRLNKIVTVEAELIERKLGKISARDQKAVAHKLKKLFASWNP